MKKLLITLLFFTFYCNSSFAGSHDLAEKLMKSNNRNATNEAYYMLYQGVLECQTRDNKKANIKIQLCQTQGGVGYIELTDLNTKKSQKYAWDAISMAKLTLF